MKYLQHILMALMAQIFLWVATQNWWIGATAASAYFISRELAQAEYRWIEAYGMGLRANLPWWGRFDLTVWTKPDQWIDWAGPTFVTFLLAILLS